MRVKVRNLGKIVSLIPETTEEAGLLLWLSERFCDHDDISLDLNSYMNTGLIDEHIYEMALDIIPKSIKGFLTGFKVKGTSV